MTKLTWTMGKAKLCDLAEYEKNPVELTEHDARQLAKSIKKYPEVLPYIAAAPKNGGSIPLLDGHQRKKVSIELLKMSPDSLVDVRFPSRKLTEKERQELIVRLRKNTGRFDNDGLLNWFEPSDLQGWGFNQKELEFIGFEFEDTTKDAEPQVDRAAELLKKWKVKSGDLFQIGNHRLICGDCTDAAVVARVMGGERARMIFTDPPWNVAIGKDSNPRHRQREGLQNDDMSSEDFSLFVSAFVDTFTKACDGDVYCVLGASEWPTLDAQLRAGGYHWSATIIWVKDIFVLGRSKYHRRYEPIWYGWHKNSKSSFGDARNLDDVWEIARPKVSEEHPTMKPVELVEQAVRNSSNSGDVVFEPFSGSGTTLVACENLSRRCRAIEISPAYVAVALERMSQAFPHLKIEKVKNGKS